MSLATLALICSVMWGEAGPKDWRAQRAVGQVLMNRTVHPDFPDTVQGAAGGFTARGPVDRSCICGLRQEPIVGKATGNLYIISEADRVMLGFRRGDRIYSTGALVLHTYRIWGE